MNLKEIYLSLALFSLAFVILLLTLYPYRPSSSDSPKLPLVSTPTPTPSITWQTYQNSQYGFEFQYPENLVLKIQKINGDQDEIQLFNSKNNQLINIEYLPNFSCPKDSCKLLTPINFGKNTFTPIETETGHQIYLFNKVYRIWVNTDDDQDKISPQILSTFKFLPDTSTWKTYKNQQYGFEFKYPSNLVHKSEKTISDIGELIEDSFTTADYKSSEISSNPAYPQESIKSGLKLSLSLLKDGCQSNSPEIIKNGDMLSNVKKLSSQIPSAQYHYEWEGQSSDGVVFKINDYCPVINFNYGSNYVSTWETLRDQIISTFKLLPNTSISPTISTAIYTCPAGEWIDCMPSTDPVKKECQSAYLNWAKINCPGFKGAAL